ncbi:hypothetical protein AB7G19_30055 [Bradyrhizobium sp. 215_C5_N1_1]|uniref:hypothetical protein n=1 Tax=unclassified Bradyrhizobium TaxID=2631580 RepID=UPI003F8C7D49
MTDPTSAHNLAYELAKDFQPTVAAMVALAAAFFAYRGVAQRIAYDKEVADIARLRARISLCTRLMLRTRPLVRQAQFIVDWLKHEEVEVALKEIDDQMTRWPKTPPELDEAWQHVDAVPVAAIDSLDAFRDHLDRFEYVCANPREEKERWPKFQVNALISVAKEIAYHGSQLDKALEAEIAAIRGRLDERSSGRIV